MDYGLNIVASVKGQSRLDSALKTIGQIRNLAKDIAPIDFGTKRAGAFGDEIRKAKKELDDLGRKVTNAMQKGDKTTGLFSSTLAGATGQARAFGIALDNLNFNKNAPEAQNYANALAQAEAKAETLAATQNKLIMSARQQAGVAIGPATTLGSPEAVAQQVRFEADQINRANKLRKEQAGLVERINTLASNNAQVGQLNSKVARINLALDERRVDAAEEMTEELRDQIRQNEKIIKQNNTKNKNATDEEKTARRIRRTRKQMIGDAAQGAILGGGFPLLFGGPSFSAAGGLLGGGIAGGIAGQKASFAGGIGGSVLLAPLDAAVDAAIRLGEALEDPTKNIEALIDSLPLAGTKTKGLIRELQDLGLDAVASAVAVEELGKEIGEFGVSDIQKFKEKNDAFANEVKKLQLALAALASDKLIGFITFLTQAVTLMGRAFSVPQGSSGGFGSAGLGRAAAFATAQGQITDEGGGLGQGGGPSREQPQRLPLQSENQIKLAQRAEDIRRAEIALAGMEVSLEQDRLMLIRGQFEVESSKIRVGQESVKLAKAELNFNSAQTEADRKRLGLKKALAEAAYLEAQASQRNAETLARQAQAAYELGERQKNQVRVLNELRERTAADQAVRATSPFANQEFLLDPYFGQSSKLQAEQALRRAETLRILNEEIEQNNINMKMGAELSDNDFRALVQKDIELTKQLKLYQELQPGIDEAALAQMRFNEAMAITVPVTDAVFDNLLAVVDGTKTAQEAFADFLRSVSQLLMDAAKQMIATYISIGIARQFAGMIGGNSGAQMSSTNYFNPQTGLGVAGPNFGYAEGGYVSGPTRAIIGEGGESEYVIPESKMRESMARYSRGARGASVIPESGEAGTVGGGGGTAVVAPIDVRYTVERINDVEYVTAAQFQAGMQQAAAQGAQRGEQQTLRRLQMSGSTRRRIGL